MEGPCGAFMEAALPLVFKVLLASARPLSRALQQVWVFRFCDSGSGNSGGPREAPKSHPWAFPGPPGASRRPPGPKANQSKKPINLKELTEQWSQANRNSMNLF